MEIRKIQSDREGLNEGELSNFKKYKWRYDVEIYGNKVYTNYNQDLLPIYKKYGRWTGKYWIVEKVEDLIQELAETEELINITYYYKKDDHE